MQVPDAASPRAPSDDGPFRDELLPPDRLADDARAQAASQHSSMARRSKRSPLFGLLSRCSTDIKRTIASLASTALAGYAVPPSVEWLLDNSYLIEEQIRTVTEDLPQSYDAELPHLTEGPYQDYPRIWPVAVGLISHSDARLDADALERYVEAYQETAPLNIGETWALPIVLRIALVENIRRLAARVAAQLASELAAQSWADKLLAEADSGQAGIEPLLEAIEHDPAYGADALAFLVRLSQRIADQEREAASLQRWVDRRITDLGMTHVDAVRTGQQRRAADQVSIANSITSLRFIEATDWRGFFERTNPAERVLRTDPAGIYPAMDFLSRDRYRHSLEALASRCPDSEVDVAHQAIAQAEAALAADAGDLVRGHVGWYLISEGRYDFEQSLRYRASRRERRHRGWMAHGAALYAGGLALLTVAIAAGLAAWTVSAGAAAWAAVLLALLSVIPVSGIATDIANRLAAALWPPRPLPKLDYQIPIAAAHRTLVVVPCLLTSPAATEDVFDQLEVRYLANRDDNIHFGVLADLRPAEGQIVPGDGPIEQVALERLDELNDRYGEAGLGPFHLFLRSRRYDREEDVWMGWERKRGALVELNRRLRGATDTSIDCVRGDAAFLPGVAFVITLDSDTALPRDAARQLVSTIAHPLNRAQVDPERRVVTRGYGLVQPRVDITLPSASATPFAKMTSGPSGIDPYAGAVSDTYQDVFGEGSFTGKGIYEVDVFNTVLAGRFPDDTLLSHDLLEGNFLRVALASDISVLDDTPSDYGTHCSRLHRWTRGDWQTIPWLGRNAPGESGSRYRNPLRSIHKWKMVDNLRRSLLPASIVAYGAAGWALLPHPGWVWPVVLIGLVAFPVALRAVEGLMHVPSGVGVRGVLRGAWAGFVADAARTAMSLAFLPHQAFLLLDATMRALWRMKVSHRRLLEWTTAAEARAAAGSTVSAYVRLMTPALPLAVLVAAFTIVLVPASRWLLVPAALLWLLSPVLAWHLSRPYHLAHPGPSAAQADMMRLFARRTWRFFERFVADEDHWLPPDNYQEDPKGEIAHRTSPTNMGLALIANLTARDLGYVSLSGVVERVERTLESMAGLERFRGHFYNWYDTQTLSPLRPAYVSTVDSGNLAGHLLVLRQGLAEALEAPLVGPAALAGTADGLRLALRELRDARGLGGSHPEADALRRDVDELHRRVALALPPSTLSEWHALLAELVRVSEGLPEAARGVCGDDSEAASAIVDGVQTLRRHLADIETLAPWAPIAAAAPRAVVENGPPAALKPLLGAVPSLVTLADDPSPFLAALDAMAAAPPGDGAQADAAAEWARAMESAMRGAAAAGGGLLARGRLAQAMASEMWDHADMRLLYDESRELFSIGFNTEQGRCDDSYYDMLASECRLASFLAVARGDVGQEHWFRLGRQFTRAGGDFALLSWSASMFEYLMPLLVMREYPDTLLDRTCAAVVKRQIEYGRERGVPWGVSESAFNTKDADLTYQYQAFGVPGLGLKRGLSDDVVIAPYATMLAVQVDLPASLANLERLEREGALGRYGFYEAVDYTPGRVPAGSRRALVRTYMAHHQGMSFVALGNGLTGSAMQRRFHADPLVAATELLLQERVPRLIKPAHPHVEEVEFVRALREPPPPVTRSYPLADTPTPATHFLSNGRYSVMVTNAGGGYSRWSDLAVSRYREDITRDCWGQHIFIRDVGSGRLWSAAHQPVCAPADDYHCILSADRAEFRRRDGEIETYTEVAVSPEDDVEVRRVALTNHSRREVTIEVTSYFEVALAPQGGDQAHRAFSNLFVETEWEPALATLLFTRRPRSSEEPRRWGLHTMSCDAPGACECSCETDRARFLGRLNQVGAAVAAHRPGPLSGTVGAVLDPVCAIRHRVTIAAGDTVRVAITTGVSETREGAMGLAEKYADIRSAQRAMDLAWGTSEVELRDLGITPEEAVVFQRLASRLVVTDAYSRLKAKAKRENLLPISALWGLGISGDNPILLVRIERLEDAAFVRQCLLAHQYWRHQGFRSDLVILNTKPSAYASDLDQRLRMLVRTGMALQNLDKPGGVFVRQADQMAPEVVRLLLSVARATLDADGGPIGLQLNRRATRPDPPDAFVPREEPPASRPSREFSRPKLLFDNGYGGIDRETGEYVIVLEDEETTPAPWVNVMAGPEFGAMVSEAGVGCTWAKNSHENRLTTWNNDPVSDGSGEIVYIRDESTGEVWSPTLLPCRDDSPYVIRHGRGYSVFEHACHGMEHRLTWFVPKADPVRVASLELTNVGDEPRTLSVTHFIEWVLGDSRSRANQRVVTRYDTEGRMLTAHSAFNEDYPGRVAFVASDRRLHSYTADRTEFLGRNGTPADPAAMHRKSLGGLTGRFHDTCGALMTQVTVEPGQTVEVRFLLGQTDTLEEARALAARYREPEAAREALVEVRAHWEELLDALRVETPDAALNAMANGRALYQTLACRMWGRTALYQSSGAFGFRDQLQDTLALLLTQPDIARAHIIEASRHQFEEGDVLHWWQPGSGRGVRTRFVDDRAWLAYALAEYVDATGDRTILTERTPFLSGPPVPEDREDLYLVPQTTIEDATVYEHAVRALESERATGPHGLPLMGGGDWNDGMNRVGVGGKGESVWMAWFLASTLTRFAPLCEATGEAERAVDYRAWAKTLGETVEREAWDGAWYRRAYFDDGTPLGTRDADECRIDAIAQAWAVISQAGDPRRAQRALESVEEKLIRWEDGLVALLTPPFDHMEHDPGYIKGYVPGVRENGGQYTHAALWVAMAYAMTGDGDEALALHDLLNPLNHALTRSDADRYVVEPYVVTADVYAVAPHVGRGGWTWYTGSASWFHNVAIGTILGIRTTSAADGARYLVVDPCIPKDWPGFSAELRLSGTRWRIRVENPRGANRGVQRVMLDGEDILDKRVPLAFDERDHEVVVTMLGG